MTLTENIKKLIYELENPAEKVTIIVNIVSPKELYDVLDYYNWDDGFDVPKAIAEHPKCELATAIKLFWLSDAIEWFGKKDSPNKYTKSHCDFSRFITARIMEGKYISGEVSHVVEFGVTQVKKLEMLGVPKIFIQPVIGRSA